MIGIENARLLDVSIQQVIFVWWEYNLWTNMAIVITLLIDFHDTTAMVWIRSLLRNKYHNIVTI